MTNGTFTDGDPPISTYPAGGGCGPLTFDVHPRFRDRGIVALAAGSHGVKFVRIGRAGQIGEAGYYLSEGGFPGDVRWMTDEIVYVVDGHWGIDILRYHRD